MKKIILSLVALSAVSSVALAGHGYSHNEKPRLSQLHDVRDTATPYQGIRIVPTADEFKNSCVYSPTRGTCLEPREIRRIDEKNHRR